LNIEYDEFVKETLSNSDFIDLDDANIDELIHFFRDESSVFIVKFGGKIHMDLFCKISFIEEELESKEDLLVLFKPLFLRIITLTEKKNETNA